MGESYEVNLLSNVHAIENKTSVSKEFTNQKRKQTPPNRKRKKSRTVTDTDIVYVSGRSSYVHDVKIDEQEVTIDITV